MADSWKDKVLTKLIEAFEDDIESWTRVVYYLGEEERVYNEKDNNNIPPAWRTLNAAINTDAPFKSYANRLAEDTKRAETDPAFRKTMNAIYEALVEPSELPKTEKDAQGFNGNRLAEMDTAKGSTLPFAGIVCAWNKIPVQYQEKILENLPKIISNRKVLSGVDECVSLVSKHGGSIVMVGLATVYLGCVAIKNIYKWWIGKITGKRCVKNVIDSSVSMGAGVAGGLGGAAVGVMYGPIGAFLGGVFFGILAAQGADVLCDRLTQWLFGIPKDEALENAYNFLGVKTTATNNEVNTAFRKLCLKHHPDKGGKAEDFITVQVNMAVIKAARGEL